MRTADKKCNPVGVSTLALLGIAPIVCWLETQADKTENKLAVARFLLATGDDAALQAVQKFLEILASE